MKIISYFFLFFPFACLTMCGNDQFYDPIWHVNLEGNNEEIMEQLNSNDGVKRYPFSFKKNLHCNNAPVEGHINSYLNYPDFEDGHLTLLRYTLTADFKDRVPFEFNIPAYEFLKNIWINAFGNPDKELDQPGNIILKWNRKEMILTVTVSKQFNSYLVEYQK